MLIIFSKNNFQICSINDGARVKRLKNHHSTGIGIGEVLKSFDRFAVVY
jgi:hypothetical protein